VVLPDYPYHVVQRGYNHQVVFAEERPAKRYRYFIENANPRGDWELIRGAVQRGQLTGNARFVNEV